MGLDDRAGSRNLVSNPYPYPYTYPYTYPYPLPPPPTSTPTSTPTPTPTPTPNQVREYDEISRLDPQKTTLLLEVMG